MSLSFYCLFFWRIVCSVVFYLSEHISLFFEAVARIFTERIRGREQASLALFEGNKYPSSFFILVVTVVVDLVADRHF